MKHIIRSLILMLGIAVVVTSFAVPQLLSDTELQKIWTQVQELQKKNIGPKKKWAELLPILKESSKADFESVRRNWNPDTHTNDSREARLMYLNISAFIDTLNPILWDEAIIFDGSEQYPTGQLINDAPFPIYVMVHQQGELLNLAILNNRLVKMNRQDAGRFVFSAKQAPQIIISTTKPVTNDSDIFIFSFDAKKSYKTAYLRFAKIEKKTGSLYTLASQEADKSKTKGTFAKKYFNDSGYPLAHNVLDASIEVQHLSFAKYEEQLVQSVWEKIEKLQQKNMPSKKKWAELLLIVKEPANADFDSVRRNWNPENHPEASRQAHVLYVNIAAFIDTLNPLLW